MTVVVTHTTPADSSFSSTGAAAWNADHALSGVGTMAEQDANAVAITGGTINGTTVGATTAAAGTFTTLTATGQTSLGGAAGSEGLRVNTVASAVNYVAVQGDTSISPKISSAGSGTNLNLLLSSKGVSGIGFYSNGFAQQQLNVTHTASAVNYVQVTGAATGGQPLISPQGSDTNISLSLTSKGVGNVNFWTNNSGSRQFAVTNTSGTIVNYATATGGATGFGAVFSTAGSDTNIPLVLQPKGTGALQAQQTDSTATGGNARGANAVDWQTGRASAGNVASGQYSVVSGGFNNAAVTYGAIVGGGQSNTANSGSFPSISGGISNTASGSYAFIGNGQSNTSAGYYNFIGGGFTNSGTSGSAVTTQSGTMNGTTAVTLSGSNGSIKVGQYITGTSIAGDTYVAAISGTSLTLSKVASGSSTSTLSFYTPHGVVVGGGNNQATGSYSFIGGGGDAGTAANRNTASGDFSFVGGGKANVASGLGSVVVGGGTFAGGPSPNTASGAASFIGGGFNNAASNFASIVIGGNGNTSNGNYSCVTGVQGSSRSINNSFVISSNALSIAGDSQTAILVIRRQTTDATATVLTSDGSAATTNNQVILPNNSAYFFKGEVIAGVTGGGNTKGWTIEGVIKRGANAASTTVVGVTVSSMYADAGAVTWTIAAAADTTNGGLKITATGQAATTIRWVCKIETTEMTY